MRITAGQGTEPITIMRVLDSDNASGGGLSTSVPYWVTRAEIKPLKSVKTLQANQEKLVNGYTFLVRYRKDRPIFPDMFINYKNNRYVIHGAEPAGHKNEGLLITAMYSGSVAVPGSGSSEFTGEPTNELGGVNV